MMRSRIGSTGITTFSIIAGMVLAPNRLHAESQYSNAAMLSGMLGAAALSNTGGSPVGMAVALGAMGAANANNQLAQSKSQDSKASSVKMPTLQTSLQLPSQPAYSNVQQPADTNLIPQIAQYSTQIQNDTTTGQDTAATGTMNQAISAGQSQAAVYNPVEKSLAPNGAGIPAPSPQPTNQERIAAYLNSLSPQGNGGPSTQGTPATSPSSSGTNSSNNTGVSSGSGTHSGANTSSYSGASSGAIPGGNASSTATMGANVPSSANSNPSGLSVVPLSNNNNNTDPNSANSNSIPTYVTPGGNSSSSGNSSNGSSMSMEQRLSGNSSQASVAAHDASVQRRVSRLLASPRE